MWDRRARYMSNHDGDGARMMLDQGFFDTKIIDVRLLGVYAPELGQPGGQETKLFVEDWFLKRQVDSASRWNFIVTTARMKIADKEQKTFDRYLAFVTTLNGSDSLNRDVLEFLGRNNYGRGIE